MLETGQFLGMLSRDAILNGLRTEGGEVPIGRLVRTDCEPLEATMALDEALHRMRLGRHAASATGASAPSGAQPGTREQRHVSG